MWARRAVSPDSLYLVFAGLKSGLSELGDFPADPDGGMDVLRKGWGGKPRSTTRSGNKNERIAISFKQARRKRILTGFAQSHD